VALVLYFGQFLVAGLFGALAAWTGIDWLGRVGYWLPGGASLVMTSPVQTEQGQPAWWAGALALLAYGVITAVAGSAITIRRDIS
jgi:hypothetical protein